MKTSVRMVMWLTVTPLVVSFRIRSLIFGANRALEGSSQSLSGWPGVSGQYVRRAFLSRVLAHCHQTVTVEFGTLFSRVGARLDENVYVGPRCHLGLVHIGRDVLIGAGVHIPSGPHTHGSSDLTVPMREQPGNERCVTVGAGSWIGSSAVILADVGRETIVGAGAVVTSPLPDRVVAGGVPARVIRPRELPQSR